jgi:hypothetical protein
MTKHEAIQIIGAQQFSGYAGYGGRLRYAGPFEDESPQEPDGTVLNGIAAIDALDGRGVDFSIPVQLEVEHMLREMNKVTSLERSMDNRLSPASLLWILDLVTRDTGVP